MMLLIGRALPYIPAKVSMAGLARSLTVSLKNTGAGADYPVSGAGNNPGRIAFIGRNNARH
jgi:hypothetical protein